MENSKVKYKTIDLPIEVFENALIDGDLSEVEDFESIFDEYCQCVGGDSYKAQIDSLKEVTLLKSKIMLAQNIMAMLATVPTDFSKVSDDTTTYLIPSYSCLPIFLGLSHSMSSRLFFTLQSLAL